MSARPARPFRLVWVGVGGQGCVTAGRVVGEAAMAQGFEARVGEIHGLSQRGGGVECTVVIGPGHTGRVEPGQADAVVSLEPLEALRAIGYVSGRTHVLVNGGRIVPFLLTLGGDSYPAPDAVLEPLRRAAKDVFLVDASALAAEAGSAQSTNVVMLGCLAASNVLPFPGEALWDATARKSPPRSLETNRRAFASGREAAARRSPA